MNTWLITLLALISVDVIGRGADYNQDAQETLSNIVEQDGISPEDHYRLQNMVRSRAMSYELERGIAGNAIQYQDFSLLAEVLRNGRLRLEDLAPYLHMPECNAQCVKALTDYGCSPDGRQEGKTPLHRAASHGDFAKILALLRAGANGSLTDRDGNNAAHIAAAECINLKVATEILERLTSARERRNNKGVSAVDIYLKRIRLNCP